MVDSEKIKQLRDRVNGLLGEKPRPGDPLEARLGFIDKTKDPNHLAIMGEYSEHAAGAAYEAAIGHLYNAKPDAYSTVEDQVLETLLMTYVRSSIEVLDPEFLRILDEQKARNRWSDEQVKQALSNQFKHLHRDEDGQPIDVFAYKSQLSGKTREQVGQFFASLRDTASKGHGKYLLQSAQQGMLSHRDVPGLTGMISGHLPDDNHTVEYDPDPGKLVGTLNAVKPTDYGRIPLIKKHT